MVDRSRRVPACRRGHETGRRLLVAGGRHDEGIAFLEALEESQLDPPARAQRHLGLVILLVPGDRTRAAAEALAVSDCDPDPCSPARLQADIMTGLFLMQTDPVAAVRIFDDVIARSAASDTTFFARSARDNRAHVTLGSDPAAAAAEWEDLFRDVDPTVRRWDDFFVLYNFGGACHIIGDDDSRALAMADELDRRGFSTGRSFVTYGAAFLRAFGNAGVSNTQAVREAARAMAEEIFRSATPRAITDCALACASILVSEGDWVGAAAMLSAARGPGARLPPNMAISGAIHRHYTSLVRRSLRGDEEQVYQRARFADLRPMIEAERTLGSG